MPRRTQFSRQRLTRRQLLQRAGALGAAGLLLPGRVAALPHQAARSRFRPRGGGGGELHFDNWPAYIDPTEDDEIGTVDRFIEATGIDMTYTETYNDNNEYFALIQPVLGRGNPIEPDIIAPTDWMAGRLIELGWVEELPLDHIPNAANLRADLRNPPWDPEGRFSLPWQTGITGLAYNVSATGRDLTSTEELFDEEFHGRIGMLSEAHDTLGLLMLWKGVDISTISSVDDASEALDALRQAKEDGQIRAFHGNDYFADLEAGNFAATIGWSGDIAQIAVENPDVRFAVPAEGGLSWADTMVIPSGAENIDEAAAWMNFVYDPVEAAQITAWVEFISPVEGVQDVAAEIDVELAENRLIFPDEDMLSRIHPFAYLDTETEAELQAAFADIIGA